MHSQTTPASHLYISIFFSKDSTIILKNACFVLGTVAYSSIRHELPTPYNDEIIFIDFARFWTELALKKYINPALLFYRSKCGFICFHFKATFFRDLCRFLNFLFILIGALTSGAKLFRRISLVYTLRVIFFPRISVEYTAKKKLAIARADEPFSNRFFFFLPSLLQN